MLICCLLVTSIEVGATRSAYEVENLLFMHNYSVQERNFTRRSSFESYFTLEKKVALSVGEKIPIGRIADVEIGPKSEMFVSDVGIPAVYQFDANGNFIKQIGRKGSGPGEYISPRSLSLDSSGRLYVMDSKQARIQVYDQNGDFLRTIRLGQNGSDFAVHPDGSIILFHSGMRNTLYKYSQTGNLILQFGENESGEIAISGGNVRIDSHGNIFELRPHSYQVRVYSKEGVFLKALGKKSSRYKPLEKNPQDFRTIQELEQSWTPMVGVFLLGRGDLMLTQMRRVTERNVNYFLSIYDMDGQVLAEDLEVQNYVLSTDSSGAIYLLMPFQEKDATTNFDPVILKYRLKR